MNRQLVLERYDTEIATKLRNRRPEPVAVMLLAFRTNSVLNYEYTPLLLQIRTLLQHLVLKILRELVLRHRLRIQLVSIGANLVVPTEGHQTLQTGALIPDGRRVQARFCERLMSRSHWR